MSLFLTNCKCRFKQFILNLVFTPGCCAFLPLYLLINAVLFTESVLKTYLLGLCRSILGALLHPVSDDRHPTVLPGAVGRPADPSWQHRRLELHQPSAGWHRLRQLCGEFHTKHPFGPPVHAFITSGTWWKYLKIDMVVPQEGKG